MITRFYVDNYKCLQNFEYKPKQFELIVGVNGAGKSTVFEALDKVKAFISGGKQVHDLFPPSCSTRWGNNPVQIFELEIQVGSLNIYYRLDIDVSSVYMVEKEIVKMNGITMLETEWEKENRNNGLFLKEYEDSKFKEESKFNNHSDEIRVCVIGDGRFTLLDSNRSALILSYTIVGDIVSDTKFIKINPSSMASIVTKPQPNPLPDLSNFSSYYLYLLQQKQSSMFEMLPHLREAIGGFDSFVVEEDFEAGRRDLKVAFKEIGGAKRVTSNTLKYSLEEISDGQRALIALYTILFCTLESDVTLIIDEPGNYISTRELQPWLMLLKERLEEHGGQVILISHHPEFINVLAPDNTVRFDRLHGGPVRVLPFDVQGFEGLLPSEIVARGWDNE